MSKLEIHEIKSNLYLIICISALNGGHPWLAILFGVIGFGNAIAGIREMLKNRDEI